MNDTIAAVATPHGIGGVSVIRISGPDAAIITKQIFQSKKNRKWIPWRVYSGKIINPATTEPVDEVLVTYFKSPHSYTGENTVEISCHGSPVIVEQILSIIYHLGARAALPGEFTRRAFLNGKLDLSQAEAVLQLTASESKAELRLALRMLSGSLKQPIETIRTNILNLMANLELDLDFPDDTPSIPLKDVVVQLEQAQRDLEDIIRAGNRGAASKTRLQAVLAGKV
ncbi:tRNA uridine-5-carboxymethylaminomethyl(34) synthesis GTPase MnmE, partial [bacterium]|nr:tRNA uridine-5-carboxymethylaminomethyl(34) synthesis GTPase MnmE [candidate division CSSED10-310 bacterium]